LKTMNGGSFFSDWVGGNGCSMDHICIQIIIQTKNMPCQGT